MSNLGWLIAIAVAAGVIGVFCWFVVYHRRCKETPRWAVLPFAFAATAVIAGITVGGIAVCLVAAPFGLAWGLWQIMKHVKGSWDWRRIEDEFWGFLILWPILTVLSAVFGALHETWSEFFSYFCIFGIIWFLLFAICLIYGALKEPSYGGGGCVEE